MISSRVPSTKETVFRTPLIPRPYHRINSSSESFRDQLDVRKKISSFILNNYFNYVIYEILEVQIS